MNPDISIRDAMEDDLKAIKILMSIYFLDIEEIPADNFAVAELDGRIIGACALVYDIFPEIHSIAVHPSYRGKGIGKSLIQYLLPRVRDESSVYARTTSPGFFEKAGFVETDPLKKTEIWEDCAECNRLNTCNQSVMCLKLE
ncbi:GNAT family N-acetyltransferase [Methanolobus zinderi]|uniref:GNAT family N-acetyltransferase n=1 Tax=Methanolobus zinderi TaxID=536044 RepID=A0A7D5E942_9EURY|nr:GNAT family N-acetyltransferase [Methanolobus zinderi]KXS44628.1 MAG: amino-acid acetyltransferase [Methanolobus sp. T82-4]QLC50938.1 GNAT family N-acetyltransferase [Methanolobus zinderi]